MEYYPLAVLLIGLITVVGMIIALRVNAFIALITAAMLVSLLSPGEISDKVARVAAAFGGAAGSIGIVIAMAAIIGKCLMDSGAADRIVRAFLGVLGEKRASVALMGSGFVLSMPVFFDTVFYLLVPLARSLFTRTKKNYVLYITAIATGGVITHTLVPPTPGPLLMAENLGLDVGMMILVGAMIGFPTALVGLLICQIMNRLMELPMRPYGGEPELEPLPDDKLPPLWLAVLPVLLPLVLISINTVTRSIADAEHAARLEATDITDWAAFSTMLHEETLHQKMPNDGGGTASTSPAARVVSLLDEETLVALDAAVTSGDIGEPHQATMLTGLNRVLGRRDFYQEDAFFGTRLSDEAKKQIGRNLARVPLAEVEHINRLLLESAFAYQLDKHVWETPRRKAAKITALLGNANLALLLSAAIAMGMLVRQRGLTFRELGKTTETALMSGGVIILITAGGGAFGGMLQVAGVKESVEALVGPGGQGTGLLLLAVGYGVATLMKLAQGSGTVSMITTSAMIASMGVDPTTLGFHPVYLAAAIGAGSLTGSWMNDSGFWIFARMSGLTEVETLKTWTILLGLLGVTAMGFTLLGAWLVPLV